MAINQSGHSEFSSIGETCHQCCHKISGFAASCMNRMNSEPCSIKLCQKCLLDRYGEKADQVAASQGWLCPKCRGICNCIVCMEKKGHQPTGILTNTKKATGFSTDMEKERIAACLATPLNRDVVLPQKRERGIFIDGTVDSCDSIKNPKKMKNNKLYELGNVENSNKINLSEASINGDENKSNDRRMNNNTKDKGNVSCVSVFAKNDKGKEKVSEFLVSRVTAEEVSEALQFLEFPSALEKAGVEERVEAARQVAVDAPIDMTKQYLEGVGLSSSQSDLLAIEGQDQDELLSFLYLFAKCTARARDRFDAKERVRQAQMQAERQEMQDRVARMLEEVYSQGQCPTTSSSAEATS